MSTDLNINVKAEYTPNPNSLKFIVSETLMTAGTLTYTSATEAEANPLAAKLFKVNGTVKIFMMSNFVTVDKQDEINWKDVHIEIKQAIKDELENFKKWLKDNPPQNATQSRNANDDDVRARIEEVLDKLRPALVADGGNIELVDVIGKDARLRMVGACGTCPSAMMTMKMGVERALTAELPDLIETVTQVY